MTTIWNLCKSFLDILKDEQKEYSGLRQEIPHLTEMTKPTAQKGGLVLREVHGQKWPPFKVIKRGRNQKLPFEKPLPKIKKVLKNSVGTQV